MNNISMKEVKAIKGYKWDSPYALITKTTNGTPVKRESISSRCEEKHLPL